MKLIPRSLAIALIIVSACAQEPHDRSATAAKPTAESPHATRLPRGIPGLELGMTPPQIGNSFQVTEDQDPVAALAAKYGNPDAAKALLATDKTIQKQFFRLKARSAQLPEGVEAADVRTFHNVAYQIGFHYSASTVKRLGWAGITAPYLAKHGQPVADTGSGMSWEDGRTRLSIESSGPIINVFFTDQALDIEVKKAERENP